MTNTPRKVIAAALIAGAVLAGASPAGADTPDQYQDTTLGHNSAQGWCQGTSQEVGAGVIAGGTAAQYACNWWHPRYGRYSVQDTTLGHSTQVGGAQMTAQEVGAGVIAGGSAWQG